MKKILMLLSISILFARGYTQTEEKPVIANYLKLTPRGFSWQDPVTGNASNYSGNFDFNIHYFPGLKIGGAEMSLGSEITLFDESSWVAPGDLPNGMLFDTRRDYGDKSIPIITRPAAEIPIKLDLGYKLNDTRFGLSWFRMTASDEQSGKVPGLFLDDDATSEQFGFGFVSFWNMGLDLHASRGFPPSWFEGFRDLDLAENGNYEGDFDPDKGASEWNATHDISLNSFQFTISHPVIRDEKFQLSLIGGVQYGMWKDNLIQTLNITAHTELTDRWSQNIYDESTEDSINVIVYLDYIFHNDITLKTNSSTEFNSLGAMAGVSGDWLILPSLFFNVQASAATLSGDATFSGTGIDIDDIVERDILTVYDQGGNMLFTDPLRGNEFLSGEFELPEYTRSVISLNYRLSIEARYEITNDIFLKAGYFYSLWKNLPMSPQWSYSDSYTIPYDAFALEDSWNTDIKSNISTSGFKIGVGFIF